MPTSTSVSPGAGTGAGVGVAVGVGVGAGGGLPHPYNHGSFQQKLEEFEELMKEITLQDIEATPEERRQMITENLRFDQFCDSIRALFGGDVQSQDLKAMYRKISTNPDARVDWSELFGYLNSEGEEADVSLGEDVNVFTVSARRRVGEAAGDKKRRDIMVALKYIPALDAYLSASQKGAVSVWGSKLRLQACAEINETAWVTGCDYLPSLRRMAVCTERCVSIWDSRAKGKNQQVFSVKPIDHSPQCMTWVPHGSSLLEDHVLFGDDQGYLNLLTIAAKDLTNKNAKDLRKNSQNHQIEPNKLATPIRKRKFHDDWVLKVKYYPQLKCFASCSPSPTSSFFLEEVDRILDDGRIRGVSISKGVNAFDFCVRANVLATGGVDKVIRVWHPHIFSRPTGKLIGHLFTIVDIVCNEKDQHIISLSTARVIRVWDIHTLTSLQVFTDNEERPGERRIHCMLFDNQHDRMLTGSSVLDAWPLTRSVQDTMQVPHTHDRPISQVVYNKELKQVVSVCTESTLRVWEAETGKHVYQLPELHGPNVEVTALALDKTGYRLATGANDGSLKVWDFGSGQTIKRKAGRPGDEDWGVAGLQYCMVDGLRCLIAVGWNNKMRLLQDYNDTHDISVLRDFSDIRYVSRELSLAPASRQPSFHKSSESTLSMAREQSFSKNRSPLPTIGASRASSNITSVFRKDYVLSSHELTCIGCRLPDLLATGCANGNTILWDLTKSTLERVVTLSHQPLEPTKRRLGQDNPRAVNAVQFFVHQVRKLDPAFIKILTHSHHQEQEEDLFSEDGSQPQRLHSKRPSRATSFTKTVTPSRRTSVQSSAHTIVIDQQLLRELQGKVEGRDTTAVKAKGIEETPEQTGKGDASKPAAVEGEPVSKAEVRAITGENVSENAMSSTTTPPNISITEIDGEKASENKDADRSGNEVESRNEANKEANAEDIDPESKIIIEAFDPVMVTCHQDSFIRFWNLEGEMLREITAMTRRHGSAVTAICADEDCNIMVTGDDKGYLTLWDIGKYLEKPLSEEKDLIKQLLCWRGHLTKVNQLTYVDTTKAIISGSTDGSVRVWWGTHGRFVGFFGQQRHFNFPTTDEIQTTTVLPYDINEGPLAPLKTISAREKIKAQQQKFEYPLTFDNQRWKPFRRSAYVHERSAKLEPTDSKFFAALIKPKPTSKSLESFTSGEMRQGAVFRALPVYRVTTPSRLKTPDLTGYTSVGMDSVLFGGTGGLHHKSKTRAGRDRERTPRRKKSSIRNLLVPPIGGAHSPSASARTPVSMTVGTPRR